MHIEPGIVNGAKMLLSYGTAAAAFGYAGKLTVSHIKENGIGSFLTKTSIATMAVFIFFEVFFHFPVGISEVHLIFGTSLLLILGVAPAALGLAFGLLIQGMFFAPTDLPMYAVNTTTLLVPLFVTYELSKRIIGEKQAYVDLRYSQVLKLSAIYQVGIISWVAFWAFYGQGLGAENLYAVGSFGVAYLSVILIEPLVDLGLLALAKSARGLESMPLVKMCLNRRLFA